MDKTPPLLVAALVVISLLAALGAWVWFTIPPAPDPRSLPSQALAPPPGKWLPATDRGRTLARRMAAEEKLPGLSLAVAVGGEIVWAEGFGWSDLDQRTPMAPTTRLRIGGVSQTITAAAAGLLHQRGRLDLDAAVARYLPSLPREPAQATLRQLMTHTAGLRPHRGEGGLFQGTPCADDSARLALVTAALEADPQWPAPAGSAVRYSTYGWVLAGAVIAAVADEPYFDFVRREILAPLAMAATGPDVAGETAPGSARFYYPRLMLDPRYGLQEAPAIDLSCALAAVGFLSTPSDLVRLGSAMLGDDLLSAATRAQLLAPVSLASGELTDQTLGWTAATLPASTPAPGIPIFAQGLAEPVVRRPLSATTVGGAVAGTTATLLVAPEHDLVIAVISNVSGATHVPLLAQRLAAAFVGGLATP